MLGGAAFGRLVADLDPLLLLGRQQQRFEKGDRLASFRHRQLGHSQ